MTLPQFGQNIVQIDLTSITDPLGRARYSRDFSSGIEDLITITAAAQDLTLPSVVVADLPAGITITRVVALLLYRTLEDTSGADNKISTAGPVTPAIQVAETVAGVFSDAILLVDDMMEIAASTREGGTVLLGTLDLSSVVTGNGTYDVRFDDILADGANLLLRDLQVILRIEWSG